MKELIGKTISHYKVLEKIGEGGMGVVYKAEDTNLKRTVALKFLSPQALGSKEDKQRFLHEAQSAAALDHPNICTVYEIDEVDGDTFMAMAYIDGVSLKEKIDEKPLRLNQAVEVAVQVAQGLQEAHEKGVVHRDIKSSNVMLSEKGQAKIMDFGLAKKTGQTAMTKEGITLGTVSYMSPEQSQGIEVDQRTDVWSFGVMLYEMISGQLPFKGDYEQAVIYSIMHEDAEPLTGLRTGVPMELERIVNKAMAKNREERYQRVEDMLIDLRAVQNALGASASVSRPTTAATKSSTITRVQDLRQRRVPQIVGLYFGFSFGVIQFVEWLVRNYPVSPNLSQFCFVALATLIPTVLMLAYFHGRPGHDQWTRVEKLGIPANLLAAAALLFLLFQDKELGAAVDKVRVTDEEGQTIERVIPKSEFHKRLAIFYFDNQTGDPAYDWLQYGFASLIDIDLEQDQYFNNSSGYASEMKEAGFAQGVGAPLTFKKRIANKFHRTYFLVGLFNLEGDTLILTTKIYKSKNAKLIAERSFSSTDIFDLVDAASLQLKRDLGIPEYHIEERPDLPVADMMTTSLAALELYSKAIYERWLTNDYEEAARYMEEAVKLDPTFSFGSYQLHRLYFRLGKQAEADDAIASSIKHKYKLPETYRFLAKDYYYQSKEEYQLRLDNAKVWVKLYPAATIGHHQLARAYLFFGKFEEAIQEHRIIYEMDPEGALELHHIGEIYVVELSKPQDALPYYQQYAEKFPEEARSFKELGNCYEKMGDFENARASYQKALLIEPDEIPLLTILGKLDSKLGNFDEAEAQFKSALAVATTPKDSSAAYEEIVNYYGLRGQITEAIAVNDRLLAQKAKFTSPLILMFTRFTTLGLYPRVGRETEALAILRDMEAQPLPPPFNLLPSIGYLYVHYEREDADKIEGAVDNVEFLVEKAKMPHIGDDMPWFRGVAYALREEYPQAIESYQKALAKNPNWESESYRLAASYRMLGELNKAEKTILKLFKTEPFNPNAHYEIALVYWDMGKKDKALEHLNTALRVWEEADAEFKPAIKARAKLAEWESVGSDM